MTPTQTKCNVPSYEFGQLSKRKIVAEFSGGDVTSDGGLLLIREIVKLFIGQMGSEPKHITLDMDVTDDPTHGSQEGAAFNGYYQHERKSASLKTHW